MLTASELKSGMAVRLEGVLYKVIGADYHAGGGKMAGVTHAKLRNLETGTMREWRFRADEVVHPVEPERQTMQFLYADERMGYFMHPDTFDQVAVEKGRLGPAIHYLREGMGVPVEFFEGKPVSIAFPDSVEVRIQETGAPVHGQGISNVWKEARLENGLTILVPPFIAPGEMVRVNVESGAYLERAKGGKRA